MTQLVNINKTLQLKKDATANNFTTWLMCYKAIANKEKFLNIMQGNENEPAQSSPPTAIETIALENFRKRNNNGFSYLFLSITNNKDVKSIANATNTASTTGCSKIAWLKLNRNYKLKTRRSKNKLIQTFYDT